MTDPQEFPSLQTLQDTAEIQQQVQERYSELEQAADHSRGTFENLVELFNKSYEKRAKINLSICGLKTTYLWAFIEVGPVMSN